MPWRLAAAVAAALLWLAATVSRDYMYSRTSRPSGDHDQITEEARQWVEQQSPTGRSAAVILRVDSDSLLLEQKDEGYPLEFWRNTLDLVGGNGMTNEEFLDILLRELSEEFSPEFAALLRPRLERCQELGTYSDYEFVMAADHPIATRIFTAQISRMEALAALQATAETGEEGRGVIVLFSNLAPPTRFAWAVDLVLDRYFRLGLGASDSEVRVCSKAVTAAQRHCTVHHIAEGEGSRIGNEQSSLPLRGTELTCPF